MGSSMPVTSSRIQKSWVRSAGGRLALSARMTIGACSPFEACTVMMRTASPAAPGSRLASAVEWRSQWRKPCSEGAWLAA